MLEFSLSIPVQAKYDILSLNVRGIRDQAKRRSIFLYHKDHNSKIYFLQETYSEPEDEIIWKNEWGGEIFSLTEPRVVKVFAFFCTLRYKIRSITHSVTRLEELC